MFDSSRQILNDNSGILPNTVNSHIKDKPEPNEATSGHVSLRTLGGAIFKFIAKNAHHKAKDTPEPSPAPELAANAPHREERKKKLSIGIIPSDDKRPIATAIQSPRSLPTTWEDKAEDSPV